MSTERILVRGVNWLGDAIMTTPALIRLREAKPQAHIALLTPAKLAELWQHHPAVDEVISIERSDTLICVAKRIRRGRFDTAVLFPNSPRSAMEVYLARVRERIGMARPWRTWTLTKPVPNRTEAGAGTRRRSAAEVRRFIQEQPTKPRDSLPASAHQVHDYLRIVEALGANATPLPPAIHVTATEVGAIRARFGAIEGKAVLGLNPGAEYGPAKRWPEERFVETARRVTAQINCQCWIFGGAGDVAVAERIAAAVGKGAQSLAGKTSLRELCAALKACAVVLTNDTGPMHVAAAVDTPVVVPFGSTSPELTGPGWPAGNGHELIHGEAPCAPCFRRTCPIDFRCMTSIGVERAAEAVLRAIRNRRIRERST
jgi:heptosyltransferase-2